ncbi:hypothetical protein [Streptomyces capparidis]
MEAGDAEHGVVHAVPFEVAVASAVVRMIRAVPVSPPSASVVVLP